MIPSADSLPWLLPGAGLALVVSVVASGPAGRWLGLRRVVAWLLLLDLGLVLTGTLTPLACECVVDPAAGGTCDLSRLGPPSLSDLLGPTDFAANILMFVPLGFAIALAPWSRRKAAVLGGAFALPFVIEGVQLLATDLHRACESGDLVDNLTGLALGLVVGAVAVRRFPGLSADARARPGS